MNLEGNTMKGLCTVGGFVVGTSALRMLLLNFSDAHPIKQQTLRGASRSGLAGETPSFAPSASDDTALRMHLSDFSSASIDVASSNGNDDVLGVNTSNLELEDVYKGAYGEDLPALSNMTNPELWKGMLPKDSAVSRRTSNLFDSPTRDANARFRLKLFWKNGYFWQESREETWWCMACGKKGDCKEGEVLRLVSHVCVFCGH